MVAAPCLQPLAGMAGKLGSAGTVAWNVAFPAWWSEITGPLVGAGFS